MGEQTAVGVAGSVGAAGCLSGRSTGSFPAPSGYVLVIDGPLPRGAAVLTLSGDHRFNLGFDFLITFGFFRAEFFLLAETLIKLRGSEVDI